ncbi:hypothetical protein [[Clostridium] polysaccharolyticum]|uniref:Lipoprotein n=1 Tax=[Clostridium] polysaccharolyticum TaxID=29364 RepID=A0A1I0AIJ9_9FIRM|nr:hypothetical protein [[Clostridium] polysaccharolyticum]SES93508.1 hypothetical protein SAMN04487772_105149 [[Clostridium] polysaccharolyticum]
MKKQRKRIVAILCIMALCCSLAGCKKKEKDVRSEHTGTYRAEESADPAYPVSLSLLEDNTYQFNLGMSNYFKGDYAITEENVVNLALTENASKLSDEAIKSITLKQGEKKGQLVLEKGLDGYVAAGTVFVK